MYLLPASEKAFGIEVELRLALVRGDAARAFRATAALQRLEGRAERNTPRENIFTHNGQQLA